MSNEKVIAQTQQENEATKKTRKEVLGHGARVVVKFQDYLQLPYDDDIEKYLEKQGIGPWRHLVTEFPGIQMSRLFTSTKPERISELVEQAIRQDQAYQSPNFLTYFVVDCPVGIDAEALAKALASWRSVQRAYVEGGPTPPPLVSPADDPRSVNQGYLDPAPSGIDAEYAWLVGGDGGSVAAALHFIDLEQGWTLNHEDLLAAGVSLLSGVNKAYFGHGTAVLGEVLAVDNTLGCVGIATNVAVKKVVSQWRTATTYNTAEAILDAVANLNFGDALLLEAQTTVSGSTFLPVEVEDAVFDAIRLGTALGIVIVEAAGNGSNDLDTFNHPTKGQMLNRSSAAFQDSGAIMVGAASSAAPHTRMYFSNYGSRIDCFAWGENIDTTGDGWTGNLTNTYTSFFGGTSGASPIITGAALVLQGLAAVNLGYRFSGWQMRVLLSNPATGTPSANPATDRIGVMPNLRAVLTEDKLTVAPDVYLRDFVGDTGDPHTGSISASPDIILRPTAVSNPQTAFGEGSGTENSNVLGFEAEAGQDNFIYVRARNRGGSDAANVVTTVYWAPVATLLTPDLWNGIGSITIPTVPAGDVLTVSDALIWPAAAIPATGHYCFVGLIGNTEDPAPAPADFLNWDNFTRFIRENNNVTWRNFNVVDHEPPPNADPPGFVPLPFLVPGAPDKARRMRLEVNAKLPRGARVFLEIPLHLLEWFRAVQPVKIDEQRRVALIPVNPHGRHPFAEMLFPAKFRASLRLLVNIPEALRKSPYELFVRQMYGEEEVGRVTWRLSPAINRLKRSVP